MGSEVAPQGLGGCQRGNTRRLCPQRPGSQTHTPESSICASFDFVTAQAALRTAGHRQSFQWARRVGKSCRGNRIQYECILDRVGGQYLGQR